MKPSKIKGCQKLTVASNSAKPRSSGPDYLVLALISITKFASVVDFLNYCSCCVLSTASLPDLTMSLRSKSAQNACSAVKLCKIIIVYNNDMPQKN